MKKIFMPRITRWASVPVEGIVNNETQKIVDHNVSEVIVGALSLERLLEEFIRKFFEPANQTRIRQFNLLIVRSSNLSFSGKWRIVADVIKEDARLSHFAGDKKMTEERNKHFRRILRYRNAFAHGRLSYNAENGNPAIEFFSGSPQTEIWDDVRFEKINSSAFFLHSWLTKLVEAVTSTSSWTALADIPNEEAT